MSTSANSYQEGNASAVLKTGRHVQWANQADDGSGGYSVLPAASAGVELVSNAVRGHTARAALLVRLRENVSERRVFVSVTADASTTYTVNVNGASASPSPGSSTVADILSDLKTAVDALSDVSSNLYAAGVATTAAAGDADLLEVVYSGTDTSPYFDLSVSGGSGTISGVAEPESASVDLFLVPGSSTKTNDTAPSGWSVSQSYKDQSADWRGYYIPDADVGSASRAYLRVHTLAGHGSDVGVTYSCAGTKGASSYPGGGAHIGPAYMPDPSAS